MSPSIRTICRLQARGHRKRPSFIPKFRFLITVLIFCAAIEGAYAEGTPDQLAFGGVKVLVPVPPGFNKVSTVAPPFMAFMRSIEPPLSILIEYYITDEELKEVLAGHSKSRAQTLSLSTLRNLLFREYSERDFLADASEIRRDAALDAAKARGTLDGQITESTSRITAGLPKNATPLGVFFDEHDGIGTYISQNFSTSIGVVTRVDAGITIRVHNRSVNLVCSSVINSDSDSVSIRRVCKDWAAAILKANQDSEP